MLTFILRESRSNESGDAESLSWGAVRAPGEGPNGSSSSADGGVGQSGPASEENALVECWRPFRQR